MPEDVKPNRQYRRHPEEAARPQRRLYGYKQAAEYLSLSTKEVQRLIYRGELFSVKVGRRRLVPVEELEHYVARLIIQAEAAAG